MNAKSLIRLTGLFLGLFLAQVPAAGIAQTKPERRVTKQEVSAKLKTIWHGELEFFRPDEFLEAAMDLQVLSKEDALACLREFGPKLRDRAMNLILCKLLFEPPAQNTASGPRLGLAHGSFLGKTKEEDWPLDPIELVDGVPFLIFRGSLSTNQALPETGKTQTDWFLKHWKWRDLKYVQKTMEQKQKALKKLIGLKRWVQPLSAEEKTFLADQITPVGHRLKKRFLFPSEEESCALAFSRDGQLLASAGRDKKVKLWDVAIEKEIACLEGHEDWVTSLAFFADDFYLISFSMDGSVRKWDLRTRKGEEIINIQGRALPMALSPDNKLLAIGGLTLTLWRLDTRAKAHETDKKAGHLICLAMAPDGKRLATGGEDGSVRIFLVDSCKQEREIKAHKSRVLSMTYSPKGDLIASGGPDKVVKVWEAATGKEVFALEGHGAMVRSVAFSPDGMTLASAGFDHMVRLWDLKTGKQRETLSGHKHWIYALAFSPNGATLASAGGFYETDSELILWDMTQGKDKQ